MDVLWRVEESDSVVPATPSLRPSAERKASSTRFSLALEQNGLFPHPVNLRPLARRMVSLDSCTFGMVWWRARASGARCGALGFGGFADEETERAVGGFGDSYAWGGQDFGGTVAVVGDPDGGGG